MMKVSEGTQKYLKRLQIMLFIHTRGTHYVIGTVLGTGDKVVKSTDKNLG